MLSQPHAMATSAGPSPTAPLDRHRRGRRFAAPPRGSSHAPVDLDALYPSPVTANDIKFPVAFGGRFSVIGHDLHGWDVEAAYLQVDGFNAEKDCTRTKSWACGPTSTGSSSLWTAPSELRFGPV